MLCLQAKSNSSFCLPAFVSSSASAFAEVADLNASPLTYSTLRTLESQAIANNLTDALPSEFLFPLFTTGTSGVYDLILALNTIPAPLLCTECLHALLTNLIAFIGLDSAGSEVAGSGVRNLCGDDFVDLKIPNSVVVAPASVSNSTSTSSQCCTPTASGSTGSTTTNDKTSGASARRSTKGQAKRAALLALAGLMAFGGGVAWL